MKTVDTSAAVKTRRKNLRMITVTGILSALGFALMMLELPLPFMPTFVKFDFSEIPALLATFSMGPVSGVVVCLVKNLLHLPIALSNPYSGSGIGELCNFLLGMSLVLPAGILYRVKKNRHSALIGSLIGSLLMALFSLPVNYFISYPVYAKLFSLQYILDAYNALLPGIDGLLQYLLIFNLPFTLSKGLIDSFLVFLIYKPLSPILHGKK